MSSTTHGTTPYYFVPGPSAYPVVSAIGLFFVILGAGLRAATARSRARLIGDSMRNGGHRGRRRLAAHLEEGV